MIAKLFDVQTTAKVITQAQYSTTPAKRKVHIKIDPEVKTGSFRSPKQKVENWLK